MPSSPKQKMGESNAFTIPQKGGKSNSFMIPRKKDVTQTVFTSPSRVVKGSTGKAQSMGTESIGVSNPFNIKKSGRDYPLSESPNPTFKNKF
jgi:hypothetical protein